jgi:hypothetical protein
LRGLKRVAGTLAPQVASIAPVAVVARGLACATGLGLPALQTALARGASALQANHFSTTPLPTQIGRIAALDDTRLPMQLAAWDCRATRAAWLGLQADGFIAAAAGRGSAPRHHTRRPGAGHLGVDHWRV